MKQITTTVAACVSPYVEFDPAKPDASVIALVTEKFFASEAMRGYRRVGTARVTIDLLSSGDIVNEQINALKVRRADVLASAQSEATRIDREIQSLLALPNEVQS